MKDRTNRSIRPREFYSAGERKELVVQEMAREDLQKILLSEKKSNPKRLHTMCQYCCLENPMDGGAW